MRNACLTKLRVKLLDEDGVKLSTDSKRYRVFSMVKAARNPWVERISVGRARNNDIVLPHKSVSKLHAHFTKDDQ